MAELASNVGAIPRTIIVGATALARGVRVLQDANGVCAIADNTVRGDFVTAIAGGIGEAISAYSMSDAGGVPALVTENVTAGDLAYTSATLGGFSKTSASNVLVGRHRQTAASGKLGSVELFTAA